MAKHEQIKRLALIVEYLKSNPKGITYLEALQFLERKFEDENYELKFSEKTFQRDRELIKKELKVEIKFNRSTKKFVVLDEILETSFGNVLENVLIAEAYREAQENSSIMFFEKRSPKGLHHLSDFVRAIKNKKVVSFQYWKFYEEGGEKRVVVPYGLKEFKNRWYLLAQDFKSGNPIVKTFGVDRITDVEINNTTVERKNYDMEMAFKNSFGIISTADEKSIEIVLSFEGFQGKYIKSLPLHHSQEILEDNDNELVVKLTLVPTFDFKQEILSFGKTLKVCSPKSFRNEINMEIKEMLGKYDA